ncbi:alpha-(1,3)-fucosyltransferase C-like [Mercenaria mercenaria]|uniref:alpha-(1,3)-fucosyltransferase C-like n=1 Tax=Mercenaria mercenaria TaxID=6596 RepID=UPI00234F9D1A|nr:alpha-(1,3)-fucosyltransferase C-like [Mercenaria mercenaria]XP_053380493.1 alpha-(1,3)-fucosyltransferase C-like [Mercenaria mercenaria]XP_053380494.1 alpha-(1,3)-fucosyltransferase C-like [Mercenaria mercenaria]
MKTVIVWTSYFGEWGWETWAEDSMKRCPAKCTFTRDKTIVGDADAVLFNANDMWKYRTLIGTLYEFNIPMPEVRTPSQVWILLSIEPMNTMRVSMNQFGFNWTCLHRRESTVYYPFTNWFKMSSDEIKHKETNVASPENYLKSKSKFAAAMISNCDDDARRYKIIRELKRYVEVDEFGDCSGNVICNYRKSPNECKQLYDYKFYLAFDNSFCRDYVSEKFWLTFDRGQIPVVAAPKYNLEMLPPNSYINVFDFSSIEALAERMVEVGANETLYNSFFDWKKMYSRDERSVYCKLCQELHANKTAQSYINMDGWINEDICTKQTLWSSLSALLERWLFDIGLV